MHIKIKSDLNKLKSFEVRTLTHAKNRAWISHTQRISNVLRASSFCTNMPMEMSLRSKHEIRRLKKKKKLVLRPYRRMRMENDQANKITIVIIIIVYQKSKLSSAIRRRPYLKYVHAADYSVPGTIIEYIHRSFN